MAAILFQSEIPMRWQELNVQQGKEVQGKEEVEEGQLQPRRDLPMEESNQEDEVEKEFLHPTCIDLDQDCHHMRNKKRPEVHRAVDSLIPLQAFSMQNSTRLLTPLGQFLD